MLLKDALALSACFARAAARLRCGVRVVGGARRGEPRPWDLDLLLVVPDEQAPHLAGRLAELRPAGARFAVVADKRLGPRLRSLEVADAASAGRIPVDVFGVLHSELPYALFHFTGPRSYNIRTRALAKRRGWLLNQYGLFFRASGRRVPGSKKIASERELAGLLGVAFRPPAGRS